MIMKGDLLRCEARKGSDRLATRGVKGTPWRWVLLTLLTRMPENQIKLFRASKSEDVGFSLWEKLTTSQLAACVIFKVARRNLNRPTADYPVCMNTDP